MWQWIHSPAHFINTPRWQAHTHAVTGEYIHLYTDRVYGVMEDFTDSSYLIVEWPSRTNYLLYAWCSLLITCTVHLCKRDTVNPFKPSMLQRYACNKTMNSLMLVTNKWNSSFVAMMSHPRWVFVDIICWEWPQNSFWPKLCLRVASIEWRCWVNCSFYLQTQRYHV